MLTPPTPTARQPRSRNDGWLRFSVAVLALSTLLHVLAVPVLAQETGDQDLIGVYTVTIAKPDVPLGLPDGAVLLGLWTVAFNADGTYAMERQDVGEVASGSYEVAGATLTLNDWNGIVGCGTPTDQATAAAYGWRLDETGLTLTPVSDSCPDRRILLSTRPFASFEACTTTPLGAVPLAALPEGTPTMSEATPVAAGGVAAQEGFATESDPEGAVDRLLRQATGCWATGDPARFLPLHSRAVLADLSLIGPLPEFAATLQTLMTVPLSFKRIGSLTMIDPSHAWAYVEVTFGGEPLPQRLDFVYEDGSWLMDTFFLLGPPPDDQPEP